MPSYHIQFVGDAIHKSFRIVWHDLMISGVWPHGCDGRPSPYWSVPLSAVCACARVHLCVLVHLCTVCTCIVVLCAVCLCKCVRLSDCRCEISDNDSQSLCGMFSDREQFRKCWSDNLILMRQVVLTADSSINFRWKMEKKVRNNFVIQFWIMPHFEYNFPNSSFCLWFLLTPCQLFANKILEYFTIQRSVHTESIQQWK